MRVPRARSVRARRPCEHGRWQAARERSAHDCLQEKEHHLSVEDENVACVPQRSREEVRSHALLVTVSV